MANSGMSFLISTDDCEWIIRGTKEEATFIILNGIRYDIHVYGKVDGNKVRGLFRATWLSR